MIPRCLTGKCKEGAKLDGHFWIDGCFPHGALQEAGGRPEGRFTLDGLLGTKEVDAEWGGMNVMRDVEAGGKNNAMLHAPSGKSRIVQ